MRLGEGVNYRQCKADPGENRAYGIINIAVDLYLGLQRGSKWQSPYWASFEAHPT
jgi:hypothetical protein